MAPWCLSCGAAAFLLLVHLGPVLSQSCGVPGIPGIPGVHGHNGIDGSKGERGDPGEAGQPVRGPKGMQGPQGPLGRSGMKGDVGLQGVHGRPGPKGEKGRGFNPSNQQKPFFSCKLETSQASELDTALHFNRNILPDLDPQFQGESLTNGTFTCVNKGVYFFSYHVSARSRVCLRLMKGSDSQMMMCDTFEGFLVTSGSAVLSLDVGDTVSVEATKYNTMTSQSSTSHTFTGFLIFPTA